VRGDRREEGKRREGNERKREEGKRGQTLQFLSSLSHCLPFFTPFPPFPSLFFLPPPPHLPPFFSLFLSFYFRGPHVDLHWPCEEDYGERVIPLSFSSYFSPPFTLPLFYLPFLSTPSPYILVDWGSHPRADSYWSCEEGCWSWVRVRERRDLPLSSSSPSQPICFLFSLAPFTPHTQGCILAPPKTEKILLHFKLWKVCKNNANFFSLPLRIPITSLFYFFMNCFCCITLDLFSYSYKFQFQLYRNSWNFMS
jgi:hypothetical protein